jgi:NAD-dependent dihydropyrimidine dehydrogenase PreA subunit
VLVTCSFHLTVRRLELALRGSDLWLVVADSKGVNVWCAAGAGELSTRSVVAAVKTCGVADEVDHRTLILPPLAAPGVRATDVREATGWKTRWGLVRATDIRRYLEAGQIRDEAMKRVTWGWRDRLDAGIGSMFAFYLLIAVGFALLAPALLLHFLIVTGVGFVLFLLACPWLPGRHGFTKLLWIELPLTALLIAGGPLLDGVTSLPWRTDAIIAMVSLLAFCSELGGMAPHLASDFDPLMARLGIRTIGNTQFAGTIRTDLLIGRRDLICHQDRCTQCRTCSEVCPVGLWEVTGEGARLNRRSDCTGCSACVTQCSPEAIEAKIVH